MHVCRPLASPSAQARPRALPHDEKCRPIGWEEQEPRTPRLARPRSLRSFHPRDPILHLVAASGEDGKTVATQRRGTGLNGRACRGTSLRQARSRRIATSGHGTTLELSAHPTRELSAAGTNLATPPTEWPRPRSEPIQARPTALGHNRHPFLSVHDNKMRNVPIFWVTTAIPPSPFKSWRGSE